MSDFGSIGMANQAAALFGGKVNEEFVDAVKKAHASEHQVEKGKIPTTTLNAIASQQKRTGFPGPTLKLSKDELMAMIQKLMIANLEQQSKTQSLTSKITRSQLQSLATKNIARLKDVSDKTKQSNVGSIVAQVFGWIAAAITVVASIALAAISFGAGSALVGCALVAAAIITVSVMVLTQTGAMEKLTNALAQPIEDMFKSMGMDAKAAKLASRIVSQILVAVVILAIDIGIAIISGGAGAEKAISSLMEKIVKIATMTAKIAQGAAAVAQAGGASAEVASASFKYEAGIGEADITDNKAFLAKLRLILQQEQDTLRELIEKISGTYVRMDSMIKEMHKANTQMLSQWASA